MTGACPLCAGDGGQLVVRQARWRLVRAAEPGFPAFYRVIWNSHVAEFSDLPPPERAECMDAVVRVEEVLRSELQPAKVNIASLGNMVPHVHWHVVARFPWDPTFPGSVWSAPQREASAQRLQEVQARLPQVDAQLLRILR